MSEPLTLDSERLRRAAQACRNAQGQMTGQVDWFDWVPKHLDYVADQIAAAAEHIGRNVDS